MTGFQILALGLASVVILLCSYAVAKRRLGPGPGLFWILLWAAAAIAIAQPGITVTIANLLGIDRGADLVFYCAILGGFLAFFAAYLRLRRMEREITLLTRRLALGEARVRPGSGGPTPGAEDVEASS